MKANFISTYFVNTVCVNTKNNVNINVLNSRSKLLSLSKRKSITYYIQN
jgi:hypothetical protein